MSMKVLLISPHTDDIELGAGGTVCKLLEEGHEVYWLALSYADTFVPKGNTPEMIKNEFLNVLKFIGIKEDHYWIYNFPVTRFHSNRQEILETILTIRENVHPDMVIGPSRHDVHQDHIVVYHEIIRLFKNSAKIISYEMPWNNIDFSAQFFMRLSEAQMSKKLEMLKFYKSQLELGRLYFDLDTISALAKLRGLQSSSKYAEAFEVVRWIQ